MQEKGKCYQCKNFDRFYTKGVKRFNKTTLGWCCKKGCEVGSGNSCGDAYAHRAPTTKIKSLTKYYLSDLLTQISAIRELIEEETDGNEEV